jgi:hypothetical protein
LCCDLGQGAVLKEEGTKDFEASVQRCGGMSEEGVAIGIIHGVISEIVMEFFGESLSRGKAIARRVGKTRPGENVRKRCNFRGKGVEKVAEARSMPHEIAMREFLKSKKNDVTGFEERSGNCRENRREIRENVTEF